jgi:hypothetical protein
MKKTGLLTAEIIKLDFVSHGVEKAYARQVAPNRKKERSWKTQNR